jgi:transcription initiation factor TFIID TATA-box-binding protein
MNSKEGSAVKIVNIVASGKLNREFDLEPLSAEIDAFEVQYEPETFPGLLIRFEEEGSVVIIFSSGSYTMMGMNSHIELDNLFNRFMNSLSKLGIEVSAKDSPPTVQNLICKGQLEREVDLESLTIELGLENIEYEPEQSPFLYYWPDSYDCVISIPTNGEVIITGVQDVEDAEEAFNHLKGLVESLFDD